MTGVMAVAIMSLLLIDTGLRSELVDLGAGPWLNIPMFTAVTIGYGLATNRLIDRFAARRSRRETQGAGQGANMTPSMRVEPS
jgi:hypothetical protein